MGKQRSKQYGASEQPKAEATGTVDGRIFGNVACQHTWGPTTEYLVHILSEKGILERIDSRSRKSCSKCYAVDDLLERQKHIGGLRL
jgi:hypothetical protein